VIHLPATPQPANGVVFTLHFSSLDTLAFIGYFLVVGLVAVIASRRERVAATLTALFVGVSLTRARPVETGEVERRNVAPNDKPERDIPFDVLCLGVLAATGLLYWVFF